MNKALETVKQVTVTFAIPEDWDAEDFIMELAGAYDDANREAAEQVEYTVDSTNKITTTTKGNK
jgi:hypothetical protein